MLEKRGWLSAPSHMPLHSLVKSLNTTANTGSEQPWFKPQHAVCNVYFPARMGPRPSRSTLCESIQQHAVPYAISHGRAGAAPTPRQSCLPMSSPTRASVMPQVQINNYAMAKSTVRELLCSTDPHGTSNAAPSLCPHPAQPPALQLWCPDVSPDALAEKPVTRPAHLNQPYSLPSTAPTSALTPFWK